MSTVGPWRPDASGRSNASRPSRWRRRRTSRLETTLESPEVRGRLTMRLRFAEGFVIFLVTLLVLGFWRLQVVHAKHYEELAENNRRRDIVVRAPRGLMTDRHGRLLAANRAAFNVAIVREELDDQKETLAWLASVLGQSASELEDRLAERRRGIPVFQPVVIAEDVPPEVVPAIEARARRYPGVIIQPEHKRYYPEGTLAAHVLGHVGEINREQLDAWGRDRFRMGDIVGQLGLERVHNDALAGRAGAESLVVNSVGRTVRVINTDAPVPGMTLTLTLDLELQRRAETLLEGKTGAIVVLDVKSGGVLALVSAPTFDPNLFARRFSAGEWNALTTDPARPLQNRALQSAYPPGSTFKLVMAAAGLEAGLITPETTVFCDGGGTYFGSYFRCNAAHGNVNLQQAIGRSCNVYFYDLGRRLGKDKIVEIAQHFGLGSQTGIDLLDEARGILPTTEWLATRQDPSWYPGETIGLAIGQGPITITPLQLAHSAATLASGVRIRPHLVLREEDPAARGAPVSYPVEREDLQLNPMFRGEILRGMWAVVNDSGSGWRAQHATIPIGGKTGTAQVISMSAADLFDGELPEALRDHAWFVGLAPIDDPEVVIAVLVEHGGGGGRAAAPIAGSLLAAYFEEIKPVAAEAGAVTESRRCFSSTAAPSAPSTTCCSSTCSCCWRSACCWWLPRAPPAITRDRSSGPRSLSSSPPLWPPSTTASWPTAPTCSGAS